ncbi:hypothetical protein [Methylobacterium oryzihabitans]|uniref:Uncharacterized protein n=1 Tax=Methylobacterium oryzihabitans TaxID=2499852 RepID=A0A437NVX5_9HYPH|nr:hypothetical protein [Methylobacterium oryzihabitans]RVU14178.1 hypothetical protein EOE48_24225 [Methylobacterium oryzihabitans]
MEYCDWFSIEEKDLTGTSKAGALFKIVMKHWQSHHPDGNYARKTPRKGGQAKTSYTFCSKTKPALINRDVQGRWAAEYLPINSEFGPPGAQETATTIYFAACHAIGAGNREAITDLARRFGYPEREEEGPEDKPVTQPEDILKP